MSHRRGGGPGRRHPRTADGELPGWGPGRAGIIIVPSRPAGAALPLGRAEVPGGVPQQPGREGKTKGGKGELLPSGSRFQPGFCRPAASRPRGPPPSRLPGAGPAVLRSGGASQRHRGRASCPGRVGADTCLCSRNAFLWGFCVAGLIICIFRVFDARLCFCFVDRSYMRLTEKEDETLPIDVSFCDV